MIIMSIIVDKSICKATPLIALWRLRADGSLEELAATAQVDMRCDDTFVIETPGGGGYGKA